MVGFRSLVNDTEKQNEMELSLERRQQLIEGLADWIKRRGLTLPAMILLETHQPLSFIGSQALLFFQPFLGFLVNDEIIREYAVLFEDRTSVEWLLQHLEDTPLTE